MSQRVQLMPLWISPWEGAALEPRSPLTSPETGLLESPVKLRGAVAGHFLFKPAHDVPPQLHTGGVPESDSEKTKSPRLCGIVCCLLYTSDAADE